MDEIGSGNLWLLATPDGAPNMLMQNVVPGWNVELDRGPDWMFARLRFEGGSVDELEGQLAEQILRLLDQQLAHRLVVELDGLTELPTGLVSELRTLHERVSGNGGLMRICGLSETALDEGQELQIETQIPCYRNREDAVMSSGRPSAPR